MGGTEPAAVTPAGDDDQELRGILTVARDRGMLGPGPVMAHIDHAAAFVVAASVDGRPPATVLDLGSGAGVPGLILARRWPDAVVVLLDASAARGAFLEEAIGRLGLDDRVRAVVARAEDAARDPLLRQQFAVVASRSFGPPAVTAECGAGFVAEGGMLLVSEPPDAPIDRWPTAGLSTLGLADDGVTASGSAHVRRLRRSGPLPDGVPRRNGIPAKRPLFPAPT